jgi:calcineurin-like phosphoesterase family protein
MHDIFFTSDSHFDHANFLKFTDDDGKLIRPFASVEEMNETMISRWNAVVKPQDKIWHLGDVTFRPEKFARIASRLNGHKRLLLGNHDDARCFEVMRWFDKVQLWRIFKDENFVCTHIPILSGQFRHKVQFNVHGHLHQNVIDDPQYINICVENTNYTPISMDELKQRCRRA